jgi:hypothetical protein
MSIGMIVLGVAVLVVLLGLLVWAAYQLGKDDGWDEAARWADRLVRMEDDEFAKVRAASPFRDAMDRFDAAEARPAARDPEA